MADPTAGDDEDLYSGYNDFSQGYAPKQGPADQPFYDGQAPAAGDDPYAQAAAAQPGYQPGGAPPGTRGGMGSRMGLGSRMGAPGGAQGSEERPMTAVRAAGYTSSGRGGASAGQQVFDPLGQGSQSRGPAPPLQKKEATTPEEQAKEMEKKVNELLEESAMATHDKNTKLALEKAKEAAKQERALCKFRDQNNLSDQINPDLTYAIHFNLAIQYQNNENFNEALSTYSHIVKNKAYAHSGRLRVNMGNLYFAQKKYPAAIKMYRMALDQIPNTGKEIRFKIMRNIGNAFIRVGQFQDAIQSYQSIMESLPDVRTGLNLVVCYFALGDKDKMKQAFAKLCSVRPAGQEEEEEEELPFTEADRENDVPHDDFLKREIRERQRFNNRCLMIASKLIAPVIERDFVAGFDFVIDCLRTSAFSHLINELEISKATTYLRRKEFEKAVETLKSFEKRDEKLAAIASTNLSFLYFLEGDLKNAEKYADMGVKADRFNAKAIVNRGNVYFQKGNMDKAKATYQEAVSVDVDCSEALHNLGLAYKKTNQLDEALRTFEKLHTVVPNSADVVFQLANVYEMMGNLRQAAEWLKILITLVPTDPGVLARLGNIYTKDNDEAQAYQYHNESFRFYPVQMEVISWLGAYYVKNEVYEKAIVYFQRASQIQPAEVKWQLMVASCHRRIGNYQLALETYQDIHMRFPDHVECLRYLIHLCTDLGMKDEVHEYAAKLKKAERAAEAKAQAEKDQKKNRKNRKKKKDDGADSAASGGLVMPGEQAPPAYGGGSGGGGGGGLEPDPAQEDYDTSINVKGPDAGSTAGKAKVKKADDEDDDWGDGADVADLLVD